MSKLHVLFFDSSEGALDNQYVNKIDHTIMPMRSDEKL